jgi:hypothetical protein
MSDPEFPKLDPKPNDPTNDVGIDFLFGVVFWLCVVLGLGAVLRWIGF